MNRIDKDKIILIAPGHRRLQVGAIVHLPLAILSLASWLRSKGDYAGRIRILDTQIHKPAPENFADAAVVGISVMTGSQIKYGLETASLIRSSNPDAVIVWGGIHPSLLPEQTTKHPLVDVVVIGEGEQTFLEIADAVFNGDDLIGIPGTCIQNNNEVIIGHKRPFLSLDEMPLPAYDLIDIKNYRGIEYQFDYQSSRGCPFRCAFCYNLAFSGRRYRKKSSAKVVNELIYLHKIYGVVNFGFVDDEFFLDTKRIEAIFDGIRVEGPKFGIIASCRLDVVHGFSPALLEKMKQTGVTQMFFGAESGSPRILKAIHKDIKTEDIVKSSGIIAEAGIRPILSFMSGFPGETLDDFEYTIEIILKVWDVHPLVTVNGIFPFNAYPGTELYQKAIDAGLKTPISLEEWGQWTFQYEPDSPWIDPVMKQWMEIAFYMVRFIYYVIRYEDRYKDSFIATLLKIAAWPLFALVKIRMKKRWFGIAWEWRIFAFIARRAFGYL
ncbi:radical SAM protein [Desulfococcaceae bacterium HSG8]|nr:radical SAM protein [Desulfococcaceae bacterium HSG8]